MKIDYFWPREAVKFTGIVFAVTFFTEIVWNAETKPSWMLAVSGLLFSAAMSWSICAMLINVKRERKARK